MPALTSRQVGMRNKPCVFAPKVKMPPTTPGAKSIGLFRDVRVAMFLYQLISCSLLQHGKTLLFVAIQNLLAQPNVSVGMKSNENFVADTEVFVIVRHPSPLSQPRSGCISRRFDWDSPTFRFSQQNMPTKSFWLWEQIICFVRELVIPIISSHSFFFVSYGGGREYCYPWVTYMYARPKKMTLYE